MYLKGEEIKLIKKALEWLGRVFLLDSKNRGTLDKFFVLARKFEMQDGPVSKKASIFCQFERGLVGFGDMKDHVVEMINNELVGKYLLQDSVLANPNCNMVMMGNPGTGKTTTARKYGKVLQALGFLKTNESGDLPVVEVSRVDLVGDCWGAGLKNLKFYLNKTKGGVLIIDEAHDLVMGSSDSLGREVADALNKAAEDGRGERVVMLTGYAKEMEKFLKSNPGLASRFPIKIRCPDFTTPQLIKIFHHGVTEQKLTVHDDVYTSNVLRDHCESFANSSSDGSGNGRAVRNLLEKVITAQRRRLGRLNLDRLSTKALQELKKEDFIF